MGESLPCITKRENGMVSYIGTKRLGELVSKVGIAPFMEA